MVYIIEELSLGINNNSQPNRTPKGLLNGWPYSSNLYPHTFALILGLHNPCPTSPQKVRQIRM
ncbi:MAG: hypothetical protein II416_05455 [Prevotella sp.]|nr:hypothetical protein [Prevotella sp.]